VIAIAAETGWKRFFRRPLKKAWQNRKATGIKATETIVLESGATVMVDYQFQSDVLR
jgi:hypothetical protein